MADLERFRRAPGLEWLVQRITRLPDELVQLIDQMRKEILLEPLKRLRQNTARSVYWIQRRHLLSYPRWTLYVNTYRVGNCLLIGSGCVKHTQILGNTLTNLTTQHG